MKNSRNHLLYPLIFAAVASIVAFSGIGIAAITGHLPVSQGGFELFMPIAKAEKKPGAAAVTSAAEPTYTGLTRRSGTDPVPATKPFPYRPGHRLTQAKKACATCGVVQSIEPRAQAAAAGALASGMTNALAGSERAFEATTVSADQEYGGVYSQGVANDTVSYIVRVRMEDGSFRTIYENQPPQFSIGERVKLINGSVVSIG